MGNKTHPYIDAAKVSALIFGATILIIAFLALFVVATVRESQTVEPARVEKNITPPGNIYSR
ncbi:MAG: hypothetical protein ACNYPH_07105 [Gammaproteobacteria bacterium WSBS_2016_MAG_OTU1]